MLLKCCTQNVSKFGKLGSGHKTGKDQFLFQSQRRAMPKNVQATIQLSSLHMLPRLCSKSFQLGFSSTWSENYQTYNLNLEKVVEPEIKLRSLVGTWRNQKYSRRNIYSASLTMLKLLTVWITTNLKILQEMGIPDHFTSLYSNSQNQTWSKELVQNWERSTSRLYIVTLLT